MRRRKEKTIIEKIEEFCGIVDTYNDIDSRDKEFLYETGMSIVDNIPIHNCDAETAKSVKKLFKYLASFVENVPDYYYKKKRKLIV